MKSYYKFVLLLLLVVFIIATTSTLYAQPPGLPSAPEQAPIDGGLSLLLLGGGAYALKKLKGKK